MSLLALLAMTGQAYTGAASEPAFPLDSTAQIIIDGNSISADHVNMPTLAALVGARLAGTGVSVVSAATNGETWANMRSGGDIPIESVYSPERPYLAVIANETTNSFGVEKKSVAQVKADATAYFQFIREMWPWAVVISWPALPRGHADDATYPDDRALNANIAELNAWMGANQGALGIDVWLDIRGQVAQYNHDGNTLANFERYAAHWQEKPGATFWPEFGYLHPALGTWPEDGEATGKRAIAAVLADAFKSGKVPATH